LSFSIAIAYSPPLGDLQYTQQLVSEYINFVTTYSRSHKNHIFTYAIYFNVILGQDLNQVKNMQLIIMILNMLEN